MNNLIYIVVYFKDEEIGDHEFDCMAADVLHAFEQCVDAYPKAIITGYKIKGEDR